MKQGTKPSPEELAILRQWEAQKLADRAKLSIHTVRKALAGDPVMPIYLHAMLIAAKANQ